jgi:hypothetical protein
MRHEAQVSSVRAAVVATKAATAALEAAVNAVEAVHMGNGGAGARTEVVHTTDQIIVPPIATGTWSKPITVQSNRNLRGCLRITTRKETRAKDNAHNVSY